MSLSCIDSTVVQINPDLPQCHELRGWFDSEGNSASTTSLTQGRSEGGNGNIGANFKTFGEAKKENLGMNNDKGDYYSNLAWISMIAKGMYFVTDPNWAVDSGCILFLVLHKCGSFMILQSLRLYVKSKLGILEVQNLPF